MVVRDGSNRRTFRFSGGFSRPGSPSVTGHLIRPYNGRGWNSGDRGRPHRQRQRPGQPGRPPFPAARRPPCPVPAAPARRAHHRAAAGLLPGRADGRPAEDPRRDDPRGQDRHRDLREQLLPGWSSTAKPPPWCPAPLPARSAAIKPTPPISAPRPGLPRKDSDPHARGETERRRRRRTHRPMTKIPGPSGSSHRHRRYPERSRSHGRERTVRKGPSSAARCPGR